MPQKPPVTSARALAGLALLMFAGFAWANIKSVTITSTRVAFRNVSGSECQSDLSDGIRGVVAAGWVRAFALTVLLLVIAPAPAHAVAVCTLSTTGVAFGTFSGSVTTISGTITMNCTGTGTSTAVLDLSTGSSGTYTQRQMASGTNTLAYNLYTDAAHTTIWGNNAGGTSHFTTGNTLKPPMVITATIYGSIPAQAIPAFGTYQDSVVVTLTCTNGGACTQTLTVPITAQVLGGCTVSASELNFGNYTGGASLTTGQATITAHCAAGQAYVIGLNEGSYPGATTTSRRMVTAGGADTLSYGLYIDAADTLNWGNSFDGATQNVVEGVGTGSDQTIPVYGKIDAGQYVQPGQYEDTVLVTLQF